MSQLSSKLRQWQNLSNGDEGVTYFCQGCNSSHTIKTKGEGAWTWNGDSNCPVFGPSVLVRGRRFTNKGAEDHAAWVDAGCPKPTPEFDAHDFCCHTFVGCNGAQPGEVIFLSDCTHSLAGTIQPFPELPDWMRD